MKTPKKKRVPFVVTIAIAVTTTACGDSVDTDGSGGSAGSGGGISNPPPPPLPTPKTPCPALQPGQSTACSSVGQVCGYKDQDECGWEIDVTATCAPDAVWDISYGQPGLSCNPPPPPVDFCPLTEPTVGTWCDVVESKICSYPSQCCESPYQCVDQKWINVAIECNPPAIQCPTQPPKNGEACDPCGQTFSTCEYNECANGGSITYADCFGGMWGTSKAPCAG